MIILYSVVTKFNPTSVVELSKVEAATHVSVSRARQITQSVTVMGPYVGILVHISRESVGTREFPSQVEATPPTVKMLSTWPKAQPLGEIFGRTHRKFLKGALLPHLSKKGCELL